MGEWKSERDREKREKVKEQGGARNEEGEETCASAFKPTLTQSWGWGWGCLTRCLYLTSTLTEIGKGWRLESDVSGRVVRAATKAARCDAGAVCVLVLTREEGGDGCG